MLSMGHYPLLTWHSILWATIYGWVYDGELVREPLFDVLWIHGFQVRFILNLSK